MADFRKWVLALTVLVLFAGLASAQSNNPFVCNTTSVTPQLRSEGLTELVGDILLTCTGGTAIAPGLPIPTANITVYMNGTVTSRLLGTSSVSAASEAMLLVDDPGNGGSQFGNTLPQLGCVAPLAGAGTNGCPEYIGAAGTMPTAYNAGTFATNNLGVAVNGAAGTTPGDNVFQGVVSGGSVTFYGIPVAPPVSSGATRTFRITNIRINANGITGGGPIPANAIAAVSISSPTSIQINNSTLTVGYISQSLNPVLNKALSTSGTSSTSQLFNQCNSTTSTPVALATLRYQELQATAFKVRGSTTQTVPGTIYYTESGFTPSTTAFNSTSSITGATTIPGYADWGTRLKAVFNNIPSGVSLYVSTSNLNSSANGPAGAYNTSSSFASLIVSETSPDLGPVPPPANVPAITATGTSSSIPYAPLSIVNGSASAVWEVTNSLPSSPENFDFEVFLTYTANTASNVPSIGSMTVNMSYAPIPTQGAFTLAAGSVASSTLGIPRFADTSSAKTALTIQICQTALLFPYVTSAPGFDTGVAIANTTSDPWGTSAQAGSCAIYWYGSGAPTTTPGYLASGNTYQTTIPTSANYILQGTTSAFDAYSVVQGFTGYIIAVCNFQYAHGFAFISDLGTRNFAMGYLADIINGSTASNGGSGQRPGASSTPAPSAIEANGQ